MKGHVSQHLTLIVLKPLVLPPDSGLFTAMTACLSMPSLVGRVEAVYIDATLSDQAGIRKVSDASCRVHTESGMTSVLASSTSLKYKNPTGQRLDALTLKHRMYWPYQHPAKKVLADHFGQVFFAALQSPVSTIPEVCGYLHSGIRSCTCRHCTVRLLLKVNTAQLFAGDSAQSALIVFEVMLGLTYICSVSHRRAKNQITTVITTLVQRQMPCASCQKSVTL